MRHFIFILVLFLTIQSCNDPNTFTIKTEFGDMKVQLFDSTPLHRDNFKKLVKEGYYNGTLFHRIIDGFMIQGGDPESRTQSPGSPLGSGGPGYTIAAEIGIPHFKGMLAAARMPDDLNPEKASSGSQFYIVHGGPVTDDQLNMFEHSKGFKYTTAQRDKYKKVGGFPMLDGDYTVFGEVISGLEIVDKIATQPKDQLDRPVNNIEMTIK